MSGEGPLPALQMTVFLLCSHITRVGVGRGGGRWGEWVDGGPGLFLFLHGH